MGHKTVLLKLTQNMARNFLAILLCRDCFFLCAKKGNYLQVNSGTITHSLELMKNENMSYLDQKWNNHAKRERLQVEACLSFQIFSTGKGMIFNDVLSRRTQKERLRFC